MEKNNPFNVLNVSVESNYSLFNGKDLELVYYEHKVPSNVTQVHEEFRDMVLSTEFPCAGAKTAFLQNTYRFAFYDQMASLNTTRLLAYDLFNFIQEQQKMDTDFTTFIACFNNPILLDEDNFEQLLWKQLHELNILDGVFHKWSDKVSSDINDKNFSFSFSEEAFFIVGLHPDSSRHARRFAYPTLVFNSHEQFNELKRKNKFQHLQKAIRRNDMKLQGSINPNLANHGEVSEALQYSGKYNPEDLFKCPYFNRETNSFEKI